MPDHECLLEQFGIITSDSSCLLMLLQTISYSHSPYVDGQIVAGQVEVLLKARAKGTGLFPQHEN